MTVKGKKKIRKKATRKKPARVKNRSILDEVKFSDEETAKRFQTSLDAALVTEKKRAFNLGWEAAKLDSFKTVAEDSSAKMIVHEKLWITILPLVEKRLAEIKKLDEAKDVGLTDFKSSWLSFTNTFVKAFK